MDNTLTFGAIIGRTSARRSPMLLPAFAIAFVVLFSLTASATTDNATATENQIEATLAEGETLEKNERWGEAFGLYQKFLREYPTAKRIQRRRSVARIHFDLERRYSDSSFVDTVRTSDATAALNVYAEVLLKIQSYYVDAPNWAELASFGLTSLEIAMLNPEFHQANFPDATPEQIRDAILETRRELESYNVSNRHDVYTVAHATAQSLERRINLRSSSVVYEFVCGAISALDPYSGFMSASQYGESMSQIEGNFVGLGVELNTSEEFLDIVSVIEGGSAETSGLIKGDRIVGVDSQTVSEIGSERAADLLRGPEGSWVSLAVSRNHSNRTIRLQRKRIDIPSVEDVHLADENSGVGYIRLTNFQKTTPRDFDAALWKLHRQGMRSLIVDVRGNPGGLLQASVDVADRFVTNGVIVSTRGRNPMEDYTHQAHQTKTWRVPLVVLIDENSASASEIFAAAIRDHHRGVIVGNQSYGKGSVQGIFPLAISGGGVRLTTAKFFSPKGNGISEVGVGADVLVHEVARANPELQGEFEDAGMRLGIREAVKQTGKRKVIQNPNYGGFKQTGAVISGR